MHVAAATRLFLARRPWVYWAIVVVLATTVAFAIHLRMAAIDAARASWGTTRTVLVADAAMLPGDPIVASATALPSAAIPEGALTSLPDDARLRQRVAAGEVLVDLDLTASAGPAGRANPGTVVVAVSDPLARSLTIGSHVQITADGILLADDGAVVELVDDVIFVAVAAEQAPAIAAAAHANLVSLLYLP